MNIRTIIVLILSLSAFNGNSQQMPVPAFKSRCAFTAEEILTFQLRYGFIVGGMTTLSLEDDIYDGNPAFHAIAIAKTKGMANILYGVEDKYESWFDKETNLPFRSIRKIKEGGYKYYNEAIFNRNENIVTSKLTGIHKVPENILDLSSLLYYLRRIDFTGLNKGDMLSFNMYFSDSIFHSDIIFNGRERIKTKFGTINCFRLSPVVEVGRMFKASDDLTVWLTDDDNCLPILVRMDIRIVGAVMFRLVKYENVKTPLKFETKNEGDME